MYRHPRFVIEDPAVAERLVVERTVGTLVVAAGDRFEASPLPWVVAGEVFRGHVAANNPLADLCATEVPCIVVFDLGDAYVTPSWYPSKTEHGKVVPTWNYVAVHVHGRVRAVGEDDWKREQVGALTDLMERQRPEPWAVSDAPEEFVAAQLRAIVGLEVVVDRLEAKAKLSQNRLPQDRDGVVRGLSEEGRDVVVRLMERPELAT